MNTRPRRNRKSAAIRDMVQETQLGVEHLIFPVFLKDGSDIKEPIDSLPDIYRFSVDVLLKEIESCLELGIRVFDIFPAVAESLKDNTGTYSFNMDSFYLKAIQKIKERFPEATLMSDVALDPYSSDGHDGLVKDGKILNDETLPILAKMSVAQAQAGIDIIGPSDMMDGRVGVIREALDNAGYTETSIMSYTAKYASSFYGPFRDALDSKPGFGDKKTYQMNPANSSEAMSEVDNDIDEGADIVMVKPGTPYLDMVKQVSSQFDIPVSVYQVSGEYAMIKAASEKGWLNHDSVMMESLIGFKRAGATLIATYFAKEASKLLNDE